MLGRSGFLPSSVALSSDSKNKPNPLKILFKLILFESSMGQSFHIIYLVQFSLYSFYISTPGKKKPRRDRGTCPHRNQGGREWQVFAITDFLNSCQLTSTGSFTVLSGCSASPSCAGLSLENSLCSPKGSSAEMGFLEGTIPRKLGAK